MNRIKLKRIIAVATLSFIISIFSLKSLFYWEYHVKYKKPIKLSQPKKNTKIKNIKFNKIENKTKSIINNSYNDILNVLLGKNLLVHNKNKKHTIKNKLPTNYEEFVIMSIEHARQEKEAEEKRQQELLEQQRQIEAQRQAEIAKQNQPHYINIICTAYSGSADENGGFQNVNISASGIKLNRGGNYCATPPDIPFGKTIVVEGLGEYECQDRGNKRYIKWIDENTLRIDIFMNSKKEALNFGVRTYKGYIK